jgi:hypothetical protein
MRRYLNMLCIPFVLSAITLFELLCPNPIQAELIFGMRINELPSVINPTDTVVIKATLFNSSASTENLGPIGGARVIPVPPGYAYNFGIGFLAIGPAPSGYSIEWGPYSSLPNQFVGVELPPGETFDFVFMTLRPQGGAVPLGTYKLIGQLQVFRRIDSDWIGVSFETDEIYWKVVNLPKPDVSGCIKLKGSYLVDTNVILKQKRGPNLATELDANGCFEFEDAAWDHKFDLTIKGGVVPE